MNHKMNTVRYLIKDQRKKKSRIFLLFFYQSIVNKNIFLNKKKLELLFSFALYGKVI